MVATITDGEAADESLSSCDRETCHEIERGHNTAVTKDGTAIASEVLRFDKTRASY